MTQVVAGANICVSAAMFGGLPGILLESRL